MEKREPLGKYQEIRNLLSFDSSIARIPKGNELFVIAPVCKGYNRVLRKQPRLQVNVSEIHASIVGYIAVFAIV